VTRGVPKLRKAICDWYGRKFDVSIDPESEAIVCMGAKEGIGHLVLATVHTGEVVFVPDPTYPIHTYSVVIAGGDLRTIPLLPLEGFIDRLSVAVKTTWPQPRMLILSFPNNPTTEVVTIDFFERIVEFAKEHKLMIAHDLAYADLTFDDYVAPSLLQVKGAKDIAVEFFSLSKSYSMPGWRVGFAVGNQKMIGALTRLKSYFDYGVFQPVQIASIIALSEGSASCVKEITLEYRKRRDALCRGLTRCGWDVPAPKATMFVWARIPEHLRAMGSVEFSKLLLRDAKVASSPGIGFGEYGEGYVRFALIENEHRIRQAVKGIRSVLAEKKR
jgi:alanine-synthesizing transaminase